MIAFGGRGFSTGGYAPGFVEDWFKARFKARDLVESKDGIVLSEKHKAKMIEQLQAVLG